MQAQAHPTFRLRRYWRKDAGPGKYKGSAELLDAASGERAACCDLAGSPALLPVQIRDFSEQSWRMEPHRKVMPSSWTIFDPANAIACRLDQKILAKVLNPNYRVVLTLSGSDERAYRLVDPRDTILDQFFLGPDEWALLEGETAVAKLARVKAAAGPVKGVRGWLKDFFQPLEEQFASAGSAHLLPAPVVLGMLLLVKELTDPSVA